MSSFKFLWDLSLKKLEPQFTEKSNISAYNTYIKTLIPDHEEDGIYYFKVPSSVIKDAIEERFARQIHKALKESYLELHGQNKAIEVLFNTEEEINEKKFNNHSSFGPQLIGDIPLNPYYTFDTFIVGESNILAHHAALGVANNPSTANNPLFIYGGSGLGKTHLMNAIVNQMLVNNPKARIIYTTTESFINEFVESIMNKDLTETFRKKYRTADALLIDDIQFISKAKETQEALFHIFNSLIEGNKPIVISSDKPPEEIKGLETRLVTRFKWGLAADIRFPDFETRTAILKKKAPYIKGLTNCNLDIDNEVFTYIASKDESNIRDLEGALKKVIATAQLDSTLDTITLDVAISAISSFFSSPANKIITPGMVINTICNYYNITEDALLSQSRSKDVSYPRQIAMYLLKTLTDSTYQKIGEYLKRTNHSTIIHGCNQIKQDLSNNTDLANTIAEITNKIKEA